MFWLLTFLTFFPFSSFHGNGTIKHVYHVYGGGPHYDLIIWKVKKKSEWLLKCG